METKLKIDRRGLCKPEGVLIKDIPQMKPFLAEASNLNKEFGLYVRACLSDGSPIVVMLGTGDSNCGNGWQSSTMRFYNIEYVNIDEIAVTVL